MTRPTKPKYRPPIAENIETSDEEFSSTSSFLSSPCPSRKDTGKNQGKKRNYIQSSPEKENQNQRRRTLIPKPITDSILPSSLSPRYHLQKALDNLIQAYIGLKEDDEKKEQAKLLGDYVQSVLAGENPFIREKEERERDVLKGLVEEVKALRKEVAPKTYAEKLKSGLSASTFAPSSSPSLSPPSSSAPTTSKVTNSTTNSTSPTSTRGKKKQLQERRLVLVTDQKDQPLDIFSTRNKINQLFASKLQIEKPVIASIARTREKQNILLTTTEEYNVDFLVKYKEIWSNCFSFKREQKLEPWAQIVAHGVPIPPFLGEGGFRLLKEEIETFNPIKIQGLPRWISSSEKRYNPQTRFGSIVFAVENENKGQEILKQKEILIAGVAAKVVKYLKISPTTQCTNCQKFGHIGDRCSTKACQFCAAAHLSKDHPCSICNITGKSCEHTTPLCINCKGKHFATSKDCETLKAAKLVYQ